MESFSVRVNLKYFFCVLIFLLCCNHLTTAYNEYTLDSDGSSQYPVFVEHSRHRRDTSTLAPVPPVEAAASATPAGAVNVTTATTPTVILNASVTSPPANGTTKPTEGPVTVPTASVTQVPLLGVNGSGQLHVTPTIKLPKVSDPIVPDDNFTDIFKEPEIIQSEHNLTSLTYDNHSFYNSTFIGNVSYFSDYWANITKQEAQVHAVLSNSHRRATSIHLTFDFPFYGHPIRNITVATGGFIYTGEHVHNWLAATQYIAPLMANFDTTLTNDSLIKLLDDGEKFTAFWENVTLREDLTKKFTFAVTLYKNGDIIFAYKNIPLQVQNINDIEHPVKVGISDAYLNDKIVFYVRRKTIYEYHRVSFKDHAISNSTILKIVALPTCLQYDSCDSCLNHKTGFNCTWCPQIQKCSSGTDRNKQDWMLRRCDRTAVTDAGTCAAGHADSPDSGVPAGNTVYTTDQQDAPGHETVVNTTTTEEPTVVERRPASQSVNAAPTQAQSPIGGVVGAFLAITLVCCLGAWVLYAFKNPHTRSGQILIRYRPSQWNWRRGEARYTAATIHM